MLYFELILNFTKEKGKKISMGLGDRYWLGFKDLLAV